MPYQQIAYDNIEQVKDQLKAHQSELKCGGICRQILTEDNLAGYPDYEHEGGIMVAGKRYWLYLQCLYPKCQYATSLWKLRIEGLE